MNKKHDRGRPKGTEKPGLHYLDKEQLTRFYAAVNKSRNIRDIFAFRLSLFLGLRVSELAHLRLSAINFDSEKITVNGVKGGRENTYAIDGRLWRRLKQWLKKRQKFDPENKNPYLFPSKLYSDEPMTEQALKFAFKKYSKIAGLPERFSIHSLRHSCAIGLALDGKTPIQIMKWLRHRSINSSQQYFEEVEFEKASEEAKETFREFL